MGDVLVRNLDDAVIASLKQRASENSRSLQAELNEILVRAASHVSLSEAREAAAGIRRSFGDRTFTNSASMLAGDRGR